MSTKEADEALQLGIEGCKRIYEIQREALKKKYGIDQPKESLPETQAPELSKEES